MRVGLISERSTPERRPSSVRTIHDDNAGLQLVATRMGYHLFTLRRCCHGVTLRGLAEKRAGHSDAPKHSNANSQLLPVRRARNSGRLLNGLMTLVACATRQWTSADGHGYSPKPSQNRHWARLVMN